MSGQNEHPLDDMNEILLNTGLYKTKNYEVRLLDNRRNYEVYKDGVLLFRKPASWSTYFEIEDTILNG